MAPERREGHRDRGSENLCALPTSAVHVTTADKTNSPLLTVQRIFDSGEFGGDGFSARWLEESSGYTTFESSKESSGGRDLVRHDPKTGNKEILVPAAVFVPPGTSSPQNTSANALNP